MATLIRSIRSRQSPTQNAFFNSALLFFISFLPLAIPTVVTASTFFGLDGRQHRATSALTTTESEARLLGQWSTALPRIQQQLIEKLELNNTNALYTTQISTANVLIWADKNANRQVLDNLAQLYAVAFPYAQLRQSMKYYYAHPNRRISTVELPEAQPAWLPANSSGTVLPESLLDSAQFLYAIVRLSRALVTHDMNREFIANARYLVLSHLRRWIIKSDDYPGSFQTRGWGCSEGAYSHAEHIANLQARAYGSRQLPKSDWSTPPAYCNAIVDTDLFITATIGELLLVESGHDWNDPISQEFMTILQLHLDSSLKLIRSRMTDTTIQIPDLANKRGLLLDAGIWDDYPDYRWSNYTGSKFPGWSDKKTREKITTSQGNRAHGVGWDISHARRFVQLLDTFEAMATAGLETHHSPNDLEAIALQITIATWNGSLWKPQFTNFIDGTNGWYRVNYANRANYGIPPFGFDDDIVACGYGRWSAYDPLIKTVLQARSEVDRIDQHLPEYQIQWLASVSLLLSD